MLKNSVATTKHTLLSYLFQTTHNIRLPIIISIFILSGCAAQQKNAIDIRLHNQQTHVTNQATPHQNTPLVTQANPPDRVARQQKVTSTIADDTVTISAPTDDTINSHADNELAPGIDQKNDIWNRIRARFELDSSYDKRTLAEIRWYASHQAYLDRTIERARPYLHLITLEAERLNLPAELILLPIVESAFQPFAYSHGRAAGIWQFIPSTGRIFGLKQNWWYDGRRDIDASTKAALKYLSNLNKTFKGDWLLALAAYNSGQGTVKKAIRRNLKKGKATDFWSLQLPKETRAYVPKLLAISAIINNPSHYGITLKSIANKPYIVKVNIGSQIDLALAAELADISIKELYQLNPGFNRWATAPNGPHSIMLPVDKAENFSLKLAEVPKSNRIKWARHKIKNGETLGQIAIKYHTTIAMLQQVNKLRGHIIRAGKNLIIPVATKEMNRYTLSVTQRIRAIQNSPKRGHKTRYTVKKGDTLWDIARLYRISVHKLAKWNAMAPRDILRLGQKLVIWQSGRSQQSNFLSVNPNAITRRINYIVRKGDSLARISQRFNVKIAELRRWNTLPKNKYIQPGQRITLFVDVTRQAENI